MSINIDKFTCAIAKAFREGWPELWTKPKLIVFRKEKTFIYKEPAKGDKQLAWLRYENEKKDHSKRTEDRLRKLFQGFSVEVQTVQPIAQPPGALASKSAAETRFSIQDEFALACTSGDFSEVYLSVYRSHRAWESLPEFYMIQKPKVLFDGGDLIALDNAVLIGDTYSRFERRHSPEAVETALRDHLCVLQTPGIAAPSTESHARIEVAGCPGVGDIPDLTALFRKTGDKLSFPFYHLDLYLTALELEDTAVFFLGHLTLTQQFNRCAPATLRHQAKCLNELIDATLPALMQLETRLQKKVIVERLPIILGKPMSGLQSFTNGLLIHQESTGVYFTTVPSSLNLSEDWLSEAEIASAVARTKEVMSSYGVNVVTIPVEPDHANVLIGGLHCVTKLL